MIERLPVVVLRSNDVCFLGIVRSCAAAEIPVIAVTFTWPGARRWYSELSCHLSEQHVIANPHEYPDQARAALVALGAALHRRYGQRLLVLGSSDTNLMFLSDCHAELMPCFRFMGDRDLDAGRFDILHKGRCARLLAEAGVATPLTHAVSTEDDIARAVHEMVYPCIYKPAVKDYGQTFYAAHRGEKAISVDSAAELRQRLEHELACGFELVVQEKIAFDAVTDEIPFYLYADAQGAIRQAATAIKEKIQPHPFGTATVLRLSYHSELLASARAVVEALAYRGILMIEFIRDRSDGVWKVIEINPRPWLFVDFFRRAGLNYLRCLLDDRDDLMPATTEMARPAEDDLVHVSLPPACGEHFESLGRSPTVDDARDWLASIDGDVSLTYLDPRDRDPGVAEISDFASQWNLEPDTLLAVIDQMVGRV